MHAETLRAEAHGRPVERNAALMAAAVAAALAASYAPNFRDLMGKWDADPNYSHGYLVVPIALAIAWQRRGDLRPERLAPRWQGWAALLAVLAARVWLFERNEIWTESATIPLAAASLALALGGWHLLRWAAPALAFLFFMLPLPGSVSIRLGGPLQELATWGSTGLLQLLGLPVLAEGNVILVGVHRLEVERACNGLSMIMAFVTLIAATTILSRSRPRWERVVLVLSTIPIALVSNILRIALTAWAYYQFGPDRVVFPGWFPLLKGWTVDRFAHDTAGWAMMPIALALAMLELKVMSWLVVAEEVEARPRLVMPPAYAPPRPVKKKPAASPRGDEVGPEGH